MQDYSKLRCPICKSKLSGEGNLHCARCVKTYPIVNGIPVMLSQVQSADGEQDLAVEQNLRGHVRRRERRGGRPLYRVRP